MSDQIQRLREVAEAATEGPWTRRLNEHGDEWDLRSTEGRPIARSSEWYTRVALIEESDADVEHIATFDPPTVLELLDRLERAEAAVERVRVAFDPGELTCGRLGLPCTAVVPADRWCRGCRITDALDGGER